MEEDNIGVPQPLECLQGIPIPPFLSKSFDLVDDRNLDPIISWGATGESFVVWDPVAFSRSVLTRISTTTISPGFRKVNADRWEFANEAFRRGEKHLLRNIQRRKTPRSKQIGIYTASSSESGSGGLEVEVDRLRKDRSIMMNEVAELQKQQRGTVHHMEAVSQRLQETEQKLKQIISFLGKLFQNPQFLALLKNKKEQGEIRSSRMKRKFVRYHISEPDQSKLCIEGQIVKYKPDWTNLTLPSAPPTTNPVPIEHPDYTLHDIEAMGLHVEDMPFQIENVVSREYVTSDESALSQGFAKTPEQAGDGVSTSISKDALISPEQDVVPEYFLSFPEDLTLQKNILECPSPWIESIFKQDDEWTAGFETCAEMPSSSCEIWGNTVDYNTPKLGPTGCFSDRLDIGSLRPAGFSSFDRQLTEERPVHEPESHYVHPKDDISENVYP